MSELTGEEIVKRIVSDKGALKDFDLLHRLRFRHENGRDIGSPFRSSDEAGHQEFASGDEQMRMEINDLSREINDLRREMRSLIRWTIAAILIVWGSTVLPVMMRVAGLILLWAAQVFSQRIHKNYTNVGAAAGI